MAPLGESEYFPALDALFAGDAQLISWRTASLRLSDAERPVPGGHFDKFLSDKETTNLLSLRVEAFPPPSAATKSAFLTKTAAIHVAPAAHGDYDIEVIKGDSLWLSQQVNIDEVSALRIVIVEWQNRPSFRLLHGFSEPEKTSLRAAAGIENHAASLGTGRVPDMLLALNTQSPESAFDDTTTRRRRLLEAYLSERQYLLNAAVHLVTAGQSGLWEVKSKGKNTSPLDWAEELGSPIVESQRSAAAHGDSSCLEKLVEDVQKRIAGLERGSGWMIDGEAPVPEIEEAFTLCMLEEMILFMKYIFRALEDSHRIVASPPMLAWLRMMDTYSYFSDFAPSSEAQAALMTPLQAHVSIVTLAFLKLSDSLAYLVDSAGSREDSGQDDASHFFLDRAIIAEIHELFFTAANRCDAIASPAVTAWATILFTVRELALASKDARESQLTQKVADQSPYDAQRGRRHSSSSIGSVQQSIYEDVFEIARGASHDQEPVEFLTKSAVDGSHVFEVITALATFAGKGFDRENFWIRNLLLNLLRAVMEPVGYTLEIVSTMFCVLSGSDQTWVWRQSEPSRASRDPRTMFLTDDVLMDSFYNVAQSRFPYEPLPFLKLCRILSTSSHLDLGEGMPVIAQRLRALDTFTQSMPSYFNGYDTIREDENANYVSLAQALDMVPQDQRRLAAASASQSALVRSDMYSLPSNTVGRVISESRPPVVSWTHQYSGLSFLGKWLQIAQTGSPFDTMATPIDTSDEVIAEIIGLFANLVSTACRAFDGSDGQARRAEHAITILEEASDGLERDTDLISVVLDIFEQQLQSLRLRAATERSLDILIASVHFIQALVDVLPGRIWPLLARSSLLDVDGKGGVLRAVISSIEVVSGDFTFLQSCVSLYEATIEDAVKNAVRRGSSISNSNRYASSATNIFAPTHVMRKILFALTQTMVEVYESVNSWRFNEIEQRLAVNAGLAVAFRKVILYSYGADDSHDLNAKLTAVLSISAAYLMDVFRAPSTTEVSSNPIVQVILEGLETSALALDSRGSQMRKDQLQTTLNFSISLLRAGRYLDRPITHLEARLFDSAPALVRLYAVHPDYRLPTLVLLRFLLADAAPNGGGDSPSLLGHLGVESSQSFFEALSSLDSPYNDMTLYVAIWNLLSTLVSKRQQWSAVFLLTGSSPHGKVKTSNGIEPEGGSKTTSIRGRPFLTVALDVLSQMHKVQAQAAIAMLGFVIQAQENWPWATTDIHTHRNFLGGILDYVANMNINTGSPLDQCYQIKVASLVADLLVVYMHYTRENSDTSLLSRISPAISWYGNNAVDVAAYNVSLHSNLKNNFEMKYPRCRLANLKRTALVPREFGKDYLYDVKLGDRMLGYDHAWSGTQRGFQHELHRANLNLSLVDAQIALLYSWKFLAEEHSILLAQDRAIEGLLAEVIRRCLAANTRPYPAEAIFEKIQQTRMDLALSLLQRLVDANARGPELSSLLATAWKTIRLQEATFESAFINNTLPYHRTLLNALFLALQFHIGTRKLPPPASKHRYRPLESPNLSIIVEIVNVVVGQGFRSLTAYLHDQTQMCSPKDFALVMAILQSCLRVKDFDRVSTQVVSLLMDNETPRHATTLFSWAHQLTVDGDPVYGELCVLFLVELTSIPMMAEQLAAEAVLTQLSSARLTQMLRSPEGCGPFGQRPRMYAIWATGFLPLCLNLLHAVGRGLSSEIAAFLNQFRGQLNLAANSLSSNYAMPGSTPSTGSITLTMASEVNSLALIDFVLRTYRAAGASAGVDPADIPDLAWEKKGVVEDIEELLERRRVLRNRIAVTSGKELEMTKQKPAVMGSDSESRLEEKIVSELRSALLCLAEEEA